MALGKSVKSHRLGVPVRLAAREIDSEHDHEAEVRTRKMKFHESVMMGNSPTKALSCDASSTTDITKELLQKCIDAGMDIRTISKAFFDQRAQYEILSVPQIWRQHR